MAKKGSTRRGHGPDNGHELWARHAARGICAQKKRPRPSEIDRPDVRAKRATFMKWMRRVDPDRLVFLDETGANQAMGCSHAWVLRGHEYVEPRPMNWGDNLTLVGAIRRRGWVALGTVWRAMIAKRFLAWVRRALVPRLWPGAIVMLDNLAAHKQPAVRAAIRRAGARVKFLPPYSHDFNPIESAWALVKKHIKAWAPQTGVALRRVARAGRHQVRPHHCAHWFTHAGYGCSSTFRG